MRAKDLLVAACTRSDAEACMRAWHYARRGYAKSRIHYGVWIDGRLLGAMSLGDGVDARRQAASLGVARDELIELNRMALSPLLPRCSESRALSVMVRLLRRDAPWARLLVTYADEGQAGTGVIYRAAGFLLTGVRTNGTFWRAADGTRVTELGLRTSAALRARLGFDRSRAPTRDELRGRGMALEPGRMVRYVRILHGHVAVRSLQYETLTKPSDHASAVVDGPPTPSVVGVRPDPDALVVAV